MSNTQAVHVSPYGRGWAVRFSYDGYPVAVEPTRDEAVDRARELSVQRRCDLIVFDEHGEVAAQESAAEDKPLILSEHDAAVEAALRDMKAALLRAADNVDEVLGRVVETYNPLRAAGASWADILAGQPKPLVISQLHDQVNDVVNAGASLRRATVRALLAEGASKAGIAKILGLTPQRIGQITQDDDPADEAGAEVPASRRAVGDGS